MAGSAQLRVRAAIVKGLFALPERVQRFLVGKPVRLDGQELAIEAQLLLLVMKLSGAKLLYPSLTRSRIAMDAGRQVVGGAVPDRVRTSEVRIPGAGEDIPATLFRPSGIAAPSALLIFYHGGGFVLGSRESHHSAAAFLADRADVAVLLPEYRLAPEYPFPAAAEDALSTFAYAVEHAAELSIDPRRIAVGGDSAGGNLAAVVAQQTTRAGGPAPVFQLLLYPVVDATARRRSRELFGDDFFLTDKDMTRMLDHYARPESDRADVRMSPLLAEDLSGLPPAYLAACGFDPLRDEGEAYAKRLADFGVPTTLDKRSDLIHGYANYLGAGTYFAKALDDAADALRAGLGS
ncbi:MAG TPA: alpha/beta hydrolase [Pseudonocardiaceae bacterium]|nr:alpha/beta hydrolase [Pseudonocardiaceae bacterium]